MSSIVVSGDTSGAITITAPTVAGTNTLTLPALTGTVALTSQISTTPPTVTVYTSGSGDRKSTRLNSSHSQQSRMPSSA